MRGSPSDGWVVRDASWDRGRVLLSPRSTCVSPCSQTAPMALLRSYTVVCAVLLLLAWSVSASAIPHRAAGSVSLEQSFAEFVLSFNRSYGSGSGEEYAHRFAIFAANMKEAAALQARDPSARYATQESPNVFSDVSKEEFARTHLNYRPVRDDNGSNPFVMGVLTAPKGMQIPENFDWRAPDRNLPVAVTAGSWALRAL